MKHTPTPWYNSNIYARGIEDVDGRNIASTSHSSFSSAISEANAAHIVKCVNTHGDLVEVLTRLVREADLDGMREKAGWDCWLSLADKTLAKARGE